ncbi:MAG TPA: STAS domain-containing protein [Spirochaetota bacterium]|nr:STAS domain-containing protein [Spirochaetota bacterium]HPI87681.1 STAS domain-containing protein [Spirochaetota bacterium]HPR49707.1 STAS domain-containing protein [Spirochaetota bacterium]
MKINKNDHNGSVILHIEGSLSVENLSFFQGTINQCFNENKNVLFELSEVSFIDSSTLGVIVIFYTKMAAKNLKVSIVNVKPEIYQMLNLTGVSKKIKVFNSMSEAIDDMKKL